VQFFRQPAYAMHAIYLQGGVTSKVHHIREARLAAEPPEYYSSPRLLTFSLEVDQAPADFNTWPNEQHSHEEMVQTHLRWVIIPVQGILVGYKASWHLCHLAGCSTRAHPKVGLSLCTCWVAAVHRHRATLLTTAHSAACLLVLPARRSLDKQLAQAWHGFGAALALDRTLVLPHLRCHCVRAGFAVFDCRHMGDISTTLPFTCISDHVWNLNVLYAGNSSVGPHRLSIREHTFLEHPDYPQRLKSSVAVVAHKPGTACRGQQEPCIMEAGSTPGGGLQLHLSRPPTSAQLASLLAPYQRIQRIHIDQPQHVFTRFDQDAEQRQYEALTRLLTVEWCCRRERDRGSLDPRHQLYMRPWGSRQYDRLCQVTKPLLGNVTYWC
jgi:hypothetical protein